MPIITPVTPWTKGPITVAMMNAKINDRITELQKGTARGILGSWTSTATANASSATEVTLPGLQQTITVDSGRMLNATLLVAGSVTVANDSPAIKVTINGQTSLLYQAPHPLSGTPGIIRYGGTGFSVPVAAGTVTIATTLYRANGTGSVAASSGALLQINDMGAS